MPDPLPTDAATNERLRVLFEQAPGFVAALRGPDHVFEFANAAYCRLVGHREVVGRPVGEALPEVVEQGFVALLDRVYATGEPFAGTAVPVRLQVEPGAPPHEVFLDVACQPVREADGSVSGLFVQGHDVTAAVRALAAERAGRAHAERLLGEIDGLYRASPVALIALLRGGDGHYRYARTNAAHAAMHGATPEALLGRRLDETLSPELYRRVRTVLDGVIGSGEGAVDVDVDVTGRLAADGAPTRHWRSTYYPIRDGEGQVVGVGVAAQDVTEPRHLEEDLRRRAEASAFRVTLADALRPLLDPGAIQTEAARVLGVHLGAERVVYVAVDPGENEARIAHEYARGLPPLGGSYRLDDFGPALMGEVRAGRSQAVSSVATDARLSAAGQQAFEAIGVRAHVSVPVVKDGRLAFILGVHQATARAWRPDEVALVEETAECTWAAVEQARAEAALREREARYHALFSSTDEGYGLCEIVVDGSGTAVDYRFLEVNPQFETMTGIADAVGRTAVELVPGLERVWVDTCARVALGGESLRFEQGAEALGRWFDVFAAPVAPRGRFVIVFRDVTERRRAATALVESEHRLRLALVGGRMGAWEWDLASGRTTIDPETRALWGLDPAVGVVQAEDVLAHVHPDDAPGMRARIEAAIGEVGAYAVEFRVVRPDGEVRWLAGPGRAVAGADGTAARVVGVNFDVTERRRTEDALRESEVRFRNMADHAPTLIWVTDPDGACVYLNARWYAYTGQAPEDALGFGWLAAVHPGDAAASEAEFLRANARREPFSLEYRLRRHDGVYRWAIDAGAPRFGPPGPDGAPAFLGYVGSVVDIDDQKGAEAALRKINEALEARVAERTADLEAANRLLQIRNRELHDFAYVASHDLQEPLRKVQSFAGLLLAEYADVLGEEGLFYVERTQSAAARMSSLIRDLLAFSRIATSRNPSQTVDLDAVLAAVLIDLDVRIEQTGGRVEAARLGTVQADPMQMRQLLQNLVGNALKFHRPGTPPVVRVWTEDGGGGALCIGVEDNGVGFDGKYAERIFAPFQRLHARHEYEGTGMGLAIVRRIAERHGGTVEATSVPGQGSCFTVTLAAPDAAPDAGVEQVPA